MSDIQLTEDLFGSSFYWNDAKRLSSKAYICGFCNDKVSSDIGFSVSAYYNGQTRLSHQKGIYICPSCSGPTFFDYKEENNQLPGVLIGHSIDNIPEEINYIYDEARRSYSVGAYTGSVLLSRKMLMNIAVHLGKSQGVKEGESFVYYVNFLEQNGHIPTATLSWVDHIRKQGNEATHKIDVKTAENAENLLNFIEMLLKINFEYPYKVIPQQP
jgi:hypothetical protein